MRPRKKQSLPGGHTPAGQHSPLSFYLRDSAGRPALHLRYPFPGFSRAASIPGSTPEPLAPPVFQGFPLPVSSCGITLTRAQPVVNRTFPQNVHKPETYIFYWRTAPAQGGARPPVSPLRTCIHGLGFSPADKKSSLAALTGRKGTRRGKAKKGPLGQRSAAAHAGYYNSRTETTPAVALISSWRCSTSSPL